MPLPERSTGVGVLTNPALALHQRVQVPPSQGDRSAGRPMIGRIRGYHSQTVVPPRGPSLVFACTGFPGPLLRFAAARTSWPLQHDSNGEGVAGLQSWARPPAASLLGFVLTP
jgi:hypothetical protein